MFRDRLTIRLAEMGDAPDYSRLAAEVLGIQGASADIARRLVAQALVVGDRQDHWRRVGQKASKAAPPFPGVYILRAVDGRVLYVGKAANLRRRLAAQFANRRWRTLHPAMARVATVECRRTGSEIEALLCEAQLIQELKPEANVQTGAPTLGARAIPRALIRDVVLLLRSHEADSVCLLGARTDGSTASCHVRRTGDDLASHAPGLWMFFNSAGIEVPQPRAVLAPLVFSWLAGRGHHTTRLHPDDCYSAADFCGRLLALLTDKDLFTERLVAT